MLTRRIKSYLARYLVIFALGAVSILLFTSCSDEETTPTSSSLPEMLVWPMSIADTSTEGAINNDRKLVSVECVPHARVDFTFDCNDPWMTLTNLEGTSGGITEDSFAVRFSVADLPVGTHNGTIAVRSDDVANSPLTIHVAYRVEAQLPELIVYPHGLAFTASSHEDTVLPDTFLVTCGDASSADYSIAELPDWIELSGVSGTTPDTVVVTVDPALVSTGGHVDTIWVSSEDMLDSPQIVVISFSLPSWLRQEVEYPYLIWDIRFADANTGWAAGCVENSGGAMRDGVIVGTDDGGETWELQHFISADDYEEVYGFAALEIEGQTIWAAGESGIIRCSQNGGLDWEPRSTGLADTVVKLADIEFVTDQIGWIVGEEGTILKTVDGGDTWQAQTSGTAMHLYSVSFVDELTGWTVGSSDVILHTIDGGNNWTLVPSELNDHRSVCFVDASNGWAVAGGGGIAHTSDGGINWTTQQSNIAGWLQSVFFIDDSMGWIAGQDGVLLYTDDAGSTWNLQTSNTTELLHSIFFVDDSTGWFAGNNGDIFHTTSGGN